MITIAVAGEALPPDAPPGRTYYLGTSCPPAWRERCRPLPQLQAVALAHRDEYIRQAAQWLPENPGLAGFTSTLAEKRYAGPNLYHEICCLLAAAELVRNLPEGETVRLLAPHAALAQTLADWLPRTTGRKCQVLPGRQAGRVPGQVRRFLRSRWQEARRVVHAWRRVRRMPLPALTAPVLVRTWLDGRAVRNGSFHDSYLDGVAPAGDATLYWIAAGSDGEKLWELLPRCGGRVLCDEQLLTAADLVRAFVRALLPLRALPAYRFAGIDITPLCRRALHEDWLNNRFCGYLRQQQALRRYAAGGGHPREIWYPCENQPWEKVLNLTATELFPGARRCGYQHAVLAPLFVSFCDARELSERFPAAYPHVILSASPAATARLHEWFGDRVRNAPACRYRHLAALPRAAATGDGLLVALPADAALADEVLRLLAACRDAVSCRCEVRRHPACGVPLEQLPRWRELRDWCVAGAAEEPLTAALDRAAVLLYADSTVGLEALHAGIPVICVGNPFALDCDVLPAALKRTVSDEAALRQALTQPYLPVFTERRAFLAAQFNTGPAATEE